MRRLHCNSDRRPCGAGDRLRSPAQAHGRTERRTSSCVNAKVTTLDDAQTRGHGVRRARRDVRRGRRRRGGHAACAATDTRVIDAGGRRVIPGLNDSHLHAVRGGRFYNLELRWDGVDSLERALQMIREQAERTPKGQWVRVDRGVVAVSVPREAGCRRSRS